ncbi:hypothetical protein PQX77_001702 [Marasmius sp. AFHP31]|nr:hypothetical protein PQX77_001702 [Marasmius sp. AFHP31]
MRSNNTHSLWYKDPGLRKNCFVVAFLYLGAYTLGYDSTLFNGLQSMPQWNAYFDTPSGKRLGLIMASMYFPQLVTTPIAAWISDSFGRKKAAWIGCSSVVRRLLTTRAANTEGSRSLKIIGSFVGCFALNEGMLITGRVFVGGGTTILLVVTPCWISELLHPRLRGIGGALQYTTFYVGAIVSSWCTFGTLYWTDSEWSWRLPTLLQGLGPLVLLVATFFCPESPRWLVSQGKEEEALSIFATYHANGDKEDELVQMELEEVTRTIRQENENSVTWLSLISAKNRKRMLVVTAVGTGAVGNGVLVIATLLPPVLKLVGIESPVKINAVNGGLAVFNWVISIAGALFVDKVGRRPLWLLSTASMLVAYAIMTALAAAFTHNPNKDIGLAFVFMLFFYYGSYDIAWTPLPNLYCTEILPFTIRAKAMSYMYFVQTIVLVTSVYVNPIILNAIGWKFYGVFVGCLAIYLLLAWLLFIETK